MTRCLDQAYAGGRFVSLGGIGDDWSAGPAVNLLVRHHDVVLYGCRQPIVIDIGLHGAGDVADQCCPGAIFRWN